MTTKTKIINELVWFAGVNYLDGHQDQFAVKVPENMPKTKTGFMNGNLFTIKDAHYAAFAQAGFGVKNIILARRLIKYDTRKKLYEVV